jgi:superfamily II DNA or RNA helicase
MDRWSLDHKRQEALVEKIATGAYTPPTIATAIPLREYQRPPVALVMATGRLGLLDEMGLGKTVTAIGAIVATGALPAVVVLVMVSSQRRAVVRLAMG